MIEAYPLCWPEGRPRHKGSREHGSFKGSFGRVRDEMVGEINRLVYGSSRPSFSGSVIVSTNIPVRQDGLPYANSREPEDPGVAVYFHRKQIQQCFACDRYDRVWKNMRAIQKTIEAMRGIERWGSSDALDRAFTGFAALPAPGPRPWWEVMGLNGTESPAVVKAHYRELAKRRHPDAGGSDQQFAELQEAYQAAMKGVANV